MVKKINGSEFDNASSYNKKNRKIDWKKFFIILTITISVFVTGIFLGNLITEIKFQSISNAEQSLRLELLGLDLQSSLIADNPCKVFNDTFLSKNLDELGNKVSYLENMNGVDDVDVKNTKTYYSLLQIRHYLLKKKAVKECNIRHDFILFFYSNEEYCEKNCKEQGFVITNIREHRNTTSAYSFDISISNPALDTLKSQYNIGEIAPVVVINGVTYKGFQTKSFIEDLLENY
jgi:hypothetical protein